MSMTLLALTVVVALAQIFPGYCRKMSPIVSVFLIPSRDHWQKFLSRYEDVIISEEDSLLTSDKYIPDVLLGALSERMEGDGDTREQSKNDSVAQGYGTFVDHLIQTNEEI